MKREDLSEQGREGRIGGETKNNEFSNKVNLLIAISVLFSRRSFLEWEC